MGSDQRKHVERKINAAGRLSLYRGMPLAIGFKTVKPPNQQIIVICHG